MSLTLRVDAIEQLPQIPATDIKKLGWRSVMSAVARSGKVVVMNHNEPEAVILSVQQYAAIQSTLQGAAGKTDPSLDALRRRFQERLAALREPDAGSRLRTLMQHPAELDGKVKAGTGF